MKRQIKIIIADDITDHRNVIKSALIDDDTEIKVIGEASNGLELVRLLGSRSPDLILLDLGMPLMDGNDTMNYLSDKHPSIRVIILSGYDQQVLMDDYYLRGVKGYLPKSELSELVGAIEKVHSGGIYKFHRGAEENLFSPRHKQIINLYADGKTQQEIADELNITRQGVYKAERAIMDMLGLETKKELLNAIDDMGLKFLGKVDFGWHDKSKIF